MTIRKILPKSETDSCLKGLVFNHILTATVSQSIFVNQATEDDLNITYIRSKLIQTWK